MSFYVVSGIILAVLIVLSALVSGSEIAFFSLTKFQINEFDKNVEEWFARTAEKYFKDGVAPNKKLQKMFDQFRWWLSQIYEGLSDLKGFKVSKEMKSFFDNIVTGIEGK